jgi:hypothetical protein
MTCQDALRHSLTDGPGPMPVEAREHVRACSACARELSELRSMEFRVAGAAPPALLPLDLEHRVMARARRRRRFDGVGIPAAAALLVAATLVTAWLLSPSAPTTNSPSAPSSGVSYVAATLPAEEDSTASLLQAYDPLSLQMMDVEPAEIQEVLSPTEQGGWNG